jgi:hypothetical protein
MTVSRSGTCGDGSCQVRFEEGAARPSAGSTCTPGLIGSRQTCIPVMPLFQAGPDALKQLA